MPRIKTACLKVYVTFHGCQDGLKALRIQVKVVNLMTMSREALDYATMNCRGEAVGTWMGIYDVNPHFDRAFPQSNIVKTQASPKLP
jgi:hypothetical protein